MANITIQLDGRTFNWDLSDDVAVLIIQSLVSGLGPAKEGEGEVEPAVPQGMWKHIWAYNQLHAKYQRRFHLECVIDGYFYEADMFVSLHYLEEGGKALEMEIWRDLHKNIEWQYKEKNSK